MKNYIVYLQDGKIVKTGTCSDDSYDHKAGPDELIMEGEAKAGKQYIVDGVVTDLPEKPEGAYKFDYDSKEWVFDEITANAEAISKRNQLLAESDYTQLSDVPLADKEAWATYRQELRDLPNMPGFPEIIVWPQKPAYTLI